LSAWALLSSPSSPPTAWTDFNFSARDGVTYDPTRIAGADRDWHRLPRGGRDHPHGLSVRGLTTAASLWVVAAIGMAPARLLLAAP
jgi:hypothetical protein